MGVDERGSTARTGVGTLDPRARWIVYATLIAAAVGQAAGKIMAVDSVDYRRLEQSRVSQALDRERQRLVAEGVEGEELRTKLADRKEELKDELRLRRPFLSANDRSRWMAIRAIAETGEPYIDPFLEEPTWDTIDMVQHRGRDGELHLYSSKPPLLITLLAGPYWVLTQVTGTTLGESPYLLGRLILLPLNCGALALLLFSSARLIERFGVGDVDRLFAMTVAAFGTQLSAFTPVLNNHLIAAAFSALACDLWVRLLDSDEPLPNLSALAGLAAGFAAANELPALALTACIGLTLLIKRPSETLKRFGAGVALVGIAFFATNYWAHESVRPPYAHRSATDPDDNWYDYEYTAKGVTRDSYWRDRRGIDRGEPSKAVYAFHALVGHHGVLSLTPVWLLSLVGGAMLLASRDPTQRRFAWAALAVTAACLVFYLGLRPQSDRNYGGSTSGFRWLFWLAPVWIASIPVAVAKLQRSRIGMAIAVTLLALSVLSASYPTWNPWTHPWLHELMEKAGFDVLG